MPHSLILIIGAVAVGAVVIRALRALLQPADSLGLSLFRPYRGHPWPHGVQEQYDIRFDLRPRKAAVEVVDDIHGETVAVTHVHGDVRIAPH